MPCRLGSAGKFIAGLSLLSFHAFCANVGRCSLVACGGETCPYPLECNNAGDRAGYNAHEFLSSLTSRFCIRSRWRNSLTSPKLSLVHPKSDYMECVGFICSRSFRFALLHDWP